MTRVVEANFDGLAGPTHNYRARSQGNVLSEESYGNERLSNPKAAALQGLAKMKLLADMGLVQGVLPPHERPYIDGLRRLGFRGSDSNVVECTAKANPQLLAQFFSASAMWAANAATVTPSSDTLDGKVHFVPANLVSRSHRFLEPLTTARILKRVFPSDRHFVHHQPLPAQADFGDEGAANHLRLCVRHEERGIHLYVYGAEALRSDGPRPELYPARQTLEASQSLVRLQEVMSRVRFAQQNPSAIDAGVFHNDVIAMSNENVLVVHNQAYLGQEGVLDDLCKWFEGSLCLVRISTDELALDEVVKSYVLNSQIVTLPEGAMALVAHVGCQEFSGAACLLEKIVADENPIQGIHFVDVSASVANGGGPACLRLRVVLNEEELAAVDSSFLLTADLYGKLACWVEKHYRDQLAPEDFVDPQLLDESRRALDELTAILGTGSLYSFQR